MSDLSTIVPIVDNTRVVSIVPNNYKFNTEKKLGTRVGYTALQANEYAPNGGSIHNPTSGAQTTYDLQADGANFDSATEVQLDVFVVVRKRVAAGVGAITINDLYNRFGFHSFPINRAIASCTVTLNSKLPITSTPTEYATALLYNLKMEELQRISANGTPDNLFTYSDAALSNVLRVQADSISWGRGLGNAELIEVVDMAVDKAAISQLAGVNPALSTADDLVLHFRVREQLLAAPFQWHSNAPNPLEGATSMKLSMTFADNLAAKMIAYNTPNANDYTIGGVYLGKPRLRSLIGNPHISVQLPRTIYWNNPRFDAKIVSTTHTVADGDTRVFVTPTHPFTVIPKMYAIYAYSERTTAHEPERLYPIETLQIDFGLQRNLLMNYDSYDLFKMSRKNGYNGSLAQFIGGVPNIANHSGLSTGCVVYVLPSDFPTDNLQQSNVEYAHNFRVQAKVRNHSDAARNITLAVVAMSDAVLINDNGVFSYENASIKPEQINPDNQVFVDANFDSHHILGGAAYVGGNFWSSLKNIGKALTHPVAKQAIRLLRNAPVVSGFVGDNTLVGKAAQAIGYGKARKPAKRTARGKGVIDLGGASMNQNRLAQLLDR